MAEEPFVALITDLLLFPITDALVIIQADNCILRHLIQHNSERYGLSIPKTGYCALISTVSFKTMLR